MFWEPSFVGVGAGDGEGVGDGAGAGVGGGFVGVGGGGGDGEGAGVGAGGGEGGKAVAAWVPPIFALSISHVQEHNVAAVHERSNMIHKVRIALKFTEPGYIGLPYWPERHMLIELGKDVHPKLGPAKKEAAIHASLEKRGLSLEDYTRLQKRAARPFYTDTDDDDGDGEIVIPNRVILSFINNASQEAPKAVPRIESKGLTFVGVKPEKPGLRTGKTQDDAVEFARFVQNDVSNQRRWTVEKAISDFTATGIVQIDDEIIKPENLLKLMEYGGKYFGIGSARPQGYGR